MEMLQLLETIRAEEASVQRLFGSDGRGVRSHKQTPQYKAKLAEAAKLLADVVKGRRPAYVLQEVMTTSDFPQLFGDILDRQLLASYMEAPATWPNYTHRNTVADFRQVKRFGVYGADQVLDQVDENEPYPGGSMSEDTPFTYSVYKYGRKLPFSWETLINDDLGAFQDVPERLGRAARRSEEKFVTGLFVDSNGPHSTLYSVGHANIVTGNPHLTIPALQTAMTILSSMVDQDGEPIVIDAVELVVGPGLEVTAQNLLNGLQLWLNQNLAAGTAEQNLVTANWMKARFRLSVNYYIPIVDTINGATDWFLFASPDNGRPALELGFLRGHEQPEIFMKSPDAVKVGGGEDAMNGDFETDSIQYKVRHVFGGAQMDPKMTVASDGTG